MTNETRGNASDLSDLWQRAPQEQAQVAAERMGGGSGCVDGDAMGSPDCPVAYPSDWDPREYAEWSDDVNKAQREAKADDLFPEGCKCGNNGGGDCDWCQVYYGWDE